MGRRSLRWLCRDVLGYKDWDLIHDDMEKFMMRRSRRKLILIPRGHLKSAIITKAFTIQCLLKDPNARILIANQVWDKAREMLFEISEVLTTKSILPHLYGNFVSDRWNRDEIVIRQRTKALSAPTVGTTGVEAEMTSTHYDVIIADDLQGLQNTATKEQRDKVKKFYRSLIDLLEPGGLLIVIGTRWHNDDVYQEIIDTESEYYDITVRRVIEDGQIIFPKKFSQRFDPELKNWVFAENCHDFIDYLKKSKGSEFYSQYMNSPINEETQLFRKEYFKYWQKRPENLYTCLTVDLAISQKQEADYTVFMTTGMDPDGYIYVLDYLRGKWSPSGIVDALFQQQAKWKPDRVGMEVNGFQRTLKLAAEEQMRERRQFFAIDEIQTPNTSKEGRIKALEPAYKGMSVYHAEWMRNRELEEELQSFPNAKHDDLVDALSMAWPLLTPGSKTRTQQIKEGSWEWAKTEATRGLNHGRFFHFG